ncbi:protein FAR1-RELATED SEQUENCE 5-like [Bidens hawaiensis]|uniref:protein FAR1-RELATED SEQUENCE 5-like n=1 Tax=Bidens hawaiensis TaxID=980011 RepID=UPI00404B0757
MDTTSSSTKRRNTNIKVTGCNACIRLKVPSTSEGFEIYHFEEAHNHGLVSELNMDLTRGRRQLQFSEKEFIQGFQCMGFGPTIAHRVQASLMGGQHLVRGSKNDWKNQTRDVRCLIADADAQMVVDKFSDSMLHLDNYFSEHKVVDGELHGLFWADDISIQNYNLFGEVLAFDATYGTNRYSMIFVPFTGVDCHKKCVCFGVGLIHNETIDSYQWLLKAFLKAHRTQPPLVLTYQDPAMKKAVATVLTESKHRLCMWHVTNKIPVKINGDSKRNENIKALVHKLVWNVFIKPETFESRWHDLIEEFNLGDNNWLTDMFAIRKHWVPAYFRELPMCCLMKTTSRCESSNSQFKVYSSMGNTLVEFMNCFEKALNAQRDARRQLQHKTTTETPPLKTHLPIERHASYTYTIKTFQEVQKEIYKGLYNCARDRIESDNGLNIHLIRHKDKRKGLVGVFKATHNPTDNTFACSSKGFTHIGYLCRHIFCVFQIDQIDEIPEKYIPTRWRSDVLPSSLFKIEARYGVPLDVRSKLRQQFLSLTGQCVDRARGCYKTIPKEPSYNSKSTIVQDLIGYKIPETITITAPKGIRNKGSGSRKRKTGPGEEAKKKSKKPKRFCKKCNKHVCGHDSRNHHKFMQAKERRRKEREQRRKERDQMRNEKAASIGKQSVEYGESDETQDSYESDDTTDSDESRETDSSSDE